jgi:quercetin dioxygenase-like cupin family protein
MKRQRMHFSRQFLSIVAVLVASVSLLVAVVGRAMATAPVGTTSSVIADGNLAATIPMKFKSSSSGFGSGLDVARVLVSQVEVQPGGNVGWHQHSGPVWVVVQSGTFTVYDAECHSQAFPAGTVYLDEGDHTHVARNEGSDLLRLAVVFMLPAGGAPRIDAAQPAGCPLL